MLKRAFRDDYITQKLAVFFVSGPNAAVDLQKAEWAHLVTVLFCIFQSNCRVGI